MEQISQPLQNDELLNETVTDAELREILDRIGHAEFDGNTQTTVRDIVEGTSADPMLVARLLGEIRKEDWEKKFGQRIDEHEDRIEKLEDEKREPAQQVIVQPVYISSNNKRRQIQEQDDQTMAGLLIAAVILVPVLLYALITWLTSPKPADSPIPQSPSVNWSR